jgi:hypothetical protein
MPFKRMMPSGPTIQFCEMTSIFIERHCSADEVLQGRLSGLVAFVDADGAPGIPLEAGVE